MKTKIKYKLDDCSRYKAAQLFHYLRFQYLVYIRHMIVLAYISK